MEEAGEKRGGGNSVEITLVYKFLMAAIYHSQESIQKFTVYILL